MAPECIEAPAVARVSSACCTTASLRADAARSASRIMFSSRIGLPSSVTATAPARCNALKSVSCWPALPIVAAATGNTLITALRSGCCIQAVISGESFTGAVLGMAPTEVNPPAAAAAVPLAMLSLCACPGSRRCTCRSMKPGATTNPRASKVSSALPRIFPRSAICDTLPSRSSKSRSASSRCAGSITRPPRISSERPSLLAIIAPLPVPRPAPPCAPPRRWPLARGSPTAARQQCRRRLPCLSALVQDASPARPVLPGPAARR